MAKRRRRRNREREEAEQPDYVKYLVLLFGVAAIIVAVVVGTERESGPAREVELHEHDHPPAAPVSMEVRQIASHFVCACGSCGELELATCSCGTAVEERHLIQTELNRGTSTETILQVIHDRYGGLKPEFAGVVQHKG